VVTLFKVTWCCRSREIWDLNPAAGRREDLVGKIVFVLEKAKILFLVDLGSLECLQSGVTITLRNSDLNGS
jgi:hypothetical protein